jgi:hypothetical protein
LIAVHGHVTSERPSYFNGMNAKILILLILFGCANTESKRQADLAGCSEKSCEQMTTCSEALHAYQCGRKELDKDGDGVPCEALCEDLY